jgi:hypothetical protein
MTFFGGARGPLETQLVNALSLSQCVCADLTRKQTLQTSPEFHNIQYLLTFGTFSFNFGRP